MSVIKRFSKTFIAVIMAELMAFTCVDLSTVSVYADETTEVSVETSAGSESADTQEETASDSETESGTAADESSETAVSDESSETASESETDADDLTEETAAAALTDEGVGTGDVIDGLFCHDSNTWNEYHYRDSYFYDPSTEYNASLATMSLCLAWSAYESKTVTYGYENCEELLTQLGFVNVEANQGFKQDPTIDTIGVCIGYKNLILEDGSYTSLIAIAIRGGGYEAEWANNAILGSSGEAQGFGGARDQVITFLNEYLEAHEKELKQQPKIWIAGFSRGSAVANLTGNFIDCAIEGSGAQTDLMKRTVKNLVTGLNTQYTDVFDYGFEVPKGGNTGSQYIANNNKNLFYIVNDEDPVTQVAPSRWGFKQYGVRVSAVGNVTEADFEKQLAKLGSNLVAKYENKTLRVGGTGFKEYEANLLSVIRGKYNGTDLYTVSDNSPKYSSFAEFVPELVNYVSETIGDRSKYASDFEPCVSRLVDILMNGHGSFTNVIIDGATSKLSDGDIKDLIAQVVIAEEPLACASVSGVVISAIALAVAGPLGFFISAGVNAAAWELAAYRAKKSVKAWLAEMLDTAWDYCAQDNRSKKFFSADDAAVMKKSSTSLAEFAYSLIFDDVNGTDGRRIGTVIAYATELMDAHDPRYVMSYLMAQDPNCLDSYDPDLNKQELILNKSNINGANCGSALSDITVSIYTVDQTTGEETLIDTIKNGKLTTLISGIHVQQDSDGNDVISVVYDTMKDKDIRFKISYSGTFQYELQYRYKNVSATNTDGTSRSEGEIIPLMTGDELEFTCKQTDSFTTVKKYISVGCAYIRDDGKDLYSTGASSEFRDENDNVITDTGRIDVDSTLYLCSLTAPDNYSTVSICTPALSWAGMIKRDSSDNKMMATEVTGSTAQLPLSFDTCSGTYFIKCKAKAEQHTLTVHAKLCDSNESFSTDKGSVYIENLTREETAISDSLDSSNKYISSNQIFAGDTIKVTFYKESTYYVSNKTRFFERWKVSDSELEDELALNDDLGYATLTFTMPAHDVDLTAYLRLTDTDANGDPEITVYGRWNYRVTTKDTMKGLTRRTPTTNNWTEIYIDEEYADKTDHFLYGNAEHVFRYNSSATSGEDMEAKCFFLNANEAYEDASGNVYVFDHWDVTQTHSASDVTKTTELPCYTFCAIECNYVTDIVGTASYEYGAFYNPDGSTDPFICISSDRVDKGLHLTFTPVYRIADYTYSITLSDGSVINGTAKEGEPVTITDVLPSEKIFNGWTSSYYEVSYTEDAYENMSIVTDTENEKSVDILDDGNGGWLFYMPKGNVTISSHTTDKTYSVKVTDAGEVQGGVTEFKAGERVTIVPATTKTSLGQKVVSWTADVTDELSWYISRNGSSITSWSFTMPAKDVTLTPVFEQTSSYILSVTDCTAEALKGGNAITDNGDGTYTVPAGARVWIKPVAKDGYYVTGWNISSDDVDKTNVGDISIVITMPEADLSVEAVYQKAADPTPEPEPEAEKTAIETVTLQFTGLEGGKELPVSADCTDSTCVLIDSKTAVSWKDASGNAASGQAYYGASYTAVLTLRPASGYKFTEDSAVYLNGQTCAVTLSDNGMATVTAAFTTEKAEVTAVNGTLSISGVYSESSTAAMAAVLPGYTTMTIEGTQVNAAITWNLDEITTVPTEDFTLTGTAVPVLDNTLFTDITYMDGVSDTVTLSVAVQERTVVSAPMISPESVQPGTYQESTNVKLTDMSSHAKIYYMISTAADTSDVTAEDIISGGQVYDGSAITLAGTEGSAVSYTILTAAVIDCSYEDDKYSAGTSTAARYTYVIDRTAADTYTVTVVNGVGSGSYHAGDIVMIAASTAEPGTQFTGFGVSPFGAVRFLVDTQDSLVNSFVMPEEDITIVANYEVNEIELTIDVPDPGQPLATTASLTGNIPSCLSGFTTEGVSAEFYVLEKDETTGEVTDIKEASGNAECSTYYSVMITLDLSGVEGYTAAEDISAKLNGNSTEASGVGSQIWAAGRFDKTHAADAVIQTSTILLNSDESASVGSSVAAITGGGKYDYGADFTLSARLLAVGASSNLSFKGWYKKDAAASSGYSGDALSTSPTWTSQATDDVSYVAVFKANEGAAANITLKNSKSAEGGTYVYTWSDGSTASDTLVLSSRSVPIADCTIKYVPAGNAKTVYWLNSSGHVVGSGSELNSMTILGDQILTAVLADTGAGDSAKNVLVRFMSRYDQVVGNVNYVIGSGSITLADIPAYVGYEPAGWEYNGQVYTAAADLAAAIDADAADYTDGQMITVRPSYQKLSNTAVLKVTNSTGNVDEYPIELGKGLTVTADEAPDGKTFAYWTIKVNGTDRIVSYEQSYHFVPVTARDYEVSMVYTDEAVQTAPITTIYEMTGASNGSGYEYYVTAAYDVPAGSTFQEMGIYYGTSQEAMESNYYQSTVTKSTGAIRLHVTSAEQTLYAKAYVIYLDASGSLKTAYSDIEIYTAS